MDNDFKKADVARKFNKTFFGLLARMREAESKNADFIQLIDRASLVRKVDEGLIINFMKDKLWAYRETIKNKDIEYLYKCDFNEYINGHDDKNMIDKIINMVKNRHKERSVEEQNLIWHHIQKMLDISIEYMKLEL